MGEGYPVLVVHGAMGGADDPISIPENVSGLTGPIPNARLFVVPDGGHYLFGHTEEVKAEIKQFLCSHAAALQTSKGCQ